MSLFHFINVELIHLPNAIQVSLLMGFRGRLPSPIYDLYDKLESRKVQSLISITV